MADTWLVIRTIETTTSVAAPGKRQCEPSNISLFIEAPCARVTSPSSPSDCKALEHSLWKRPLTPCCPKGWRGFFCLSCRRRFRPPGPSSRQSSMSTVADSMGRKLPFRCVIRSAKSHKTSRIESSRHHLPSPSHTRRPCFPERLP
jgi:hypothetical protein